MRRLDARVDFVWQRPTLPPRLTRGFVDSAGRARSTGAPWVVADPGHMEHIGIHSNGAHAPAIDVFDALLDLVGPGIGDRAERARDLVSRWGFTEAPITGFDSEAGGAWACGLPVERIANSAAQVSTVAEEVFVVNAHRERDEVRFLVVRDHGLESDWVVIPGDPKNRRSGRELSNAFAAGYAGSLKRDAEQWSQHVVGAWLGDRVNAGLAAHTAAGFVTNPQVDPSTGAAVGAHQRFGMVPLNLLGVAWLLLAAVVDGQLHLKRCADPDCRRLFISKRRDAQQCKVGGGACRQRRSRRRRAAQVANR